MASDPFHNGFGMMTVHGTRKPVWRAFELLARAGTSRLAVSGDVSSNSNSSVSVFATIGDGDVGASSSSSSRTLQFFVANYHRLERVEKFACNRRTLSCERRPAGTYSDEALCSANCHALTGLLDPNATRRPSPNKPPPPAPSAVLCPPRTLTLTVKHAAGTALPAVAMAHRIDAAHANPQAEWVRLGAPTYPNQTALSALDAASEMQAEQLPVVRASDTTSTITVTLASYSAMRIILG